MSTNCKADFPLLAQRDIAYLDSAATAQRPQCVLDAEREFYTRHNANPLRGLYPLSIEATDALESARAAVARFLGAAQSEEIVFTRNTTEGLNLVAYSYGLSHVKAGDEILISTMEHHSNILPWQMVCRQTGAQLKFMECEPDGSLDHNKVEALITARTRVVALQQVSNVLGREWAMTTNPFYNEILTEHNVRPEFKHDLPDADLVLDGVNPSCGDEIQLKLKLDGDTIADGAFVGDGCAISQASTDIMLGMIVGKSREEALRLGDLFLRMIRGEASEEEIDSLEEASALRDVSHMPARVKCAMLGWRTLREALGEKTPS